jgi:hypothetical protein
MDDPSFQVSPPNDALEPSYIVGDSVSIPHPRGTKGQMPCGNQGPHYRVGPNMPMIAHLKSQGNSAQALMSTCLPSDKSRALS